VDGSHAQGKRSEGTGDFTIGQFIATIQEPVFTEQATSDPQYVRLGS
jgi:hypothetical protein